MKRIIWTLYADNKYPTYYPAYLANTLAPYDVDLNCLVVDSTVSKLLPAPNLYLFDVNEIMTINAGFRLKGWWYKMLFFKPNFWPDNLLFTDLDTVFLKDPTPIFEWCETTRAPTAFMQDLLFPKVSQSSLFYVNHAHPDSMVAWGSFITHKKPPCRGDQDFLTRFFPPSEHTTFPYHFQIQYKGIHSTSRRWLETGKVYTPEDLQSAISWHFSGRPGPHEIIEKRRPGFETIWKSGWRRQDDSIR